MDEGGADPRRASAEAAAGVIEDVVQHVAELVVVFDAEGWCLWANEGVRRLLGHDPATWVGQHAAAFAHPGDVALGMELLSSAKATGPGVKEPVTYRLAHADGTWADIEVIAAVVATPSGEPVLVVTGRPAAQARPSTAIFDEASERLAAMFDEAAIGMAQVALDGTILRANPELHRLVRSPSTLVGCSFTEVVHPDDLDRCGDLEAVSRLSGAGQPIEARLSVDGARHPTPVRLSASRVHDHLGNPLYHAVQAVDITDRVVAEQRARAREAQLRTILDLANEGIVVVDEDRTVVFANPRLLEMVGSEAGELLGRELGEVLTTSGAGDRTSSHEAVLHAAGGARRWVRVGVSPYDLGDGRPPGSVLMVTDISDLKEVQEELDHRSTHDPLTGLANRRMLERSAGRWRPDTPVAVLYVDLDGFKAINDRHGHAVGDEVLVAVAARMQAATRAEDLVARIGGDEFVIICTDTPLAVARDLGERVLAALSRPISTSVGTTTAGASVGVAHHHGGAVLDDVVRQADEALRRAKRSGRARVEVAQPA